MRHKYSYIKKYIWRENIFTADKILFKIINNNNNSVIIIKLKTFCEMLPWSMKFAVTRHENMNSNLMQWFFVHVERHYKIQFLSARKDEQNGLHYKNYKNEMQKSLDLSPFLENNLRNQNQT